ncbi:hypothetical protein HanXRQr2_Chr12g0529821 [Helianthus annuus]|uniref:Uncharacterized protein n=1 Tax=Helianthus annuus TaxID=4232 RepID=A0A251RWN5_HELAN|nr:hypothetical protein HanXRQr2_Chr12g0529821 [Helianthus annuus]KAJ0492110.1 hypothetical protein HanIR_Chr12g0571171 [Helianthus annuus]KAJ0861778.1 hypothetical protein HanPSC8_Chr12g0510501 [Helianthus annuus]
MQVNGFEKTKLPLLIKKNSKYCCCVSCPCRLFQQPTLTPSSLLATHTTSSSLPATHRLNLAFSLSTISMNNTTAVVDPTTIKHIPPFPNHEVVGNHA